MYLGGYMLIFVRNIISQTTNYRENKMKGLIKYYLLIFLKLKRGVFY